MVFLSFLGFCHKLAWEVSSIIYTCHKTLLSPLKNSLCITLSKSTISFYTLSFLPIPYHSNPGQGMHITTSRNQNHMGETSRLHFWLSHYHFFPLPSCFCPTELQVYHIYTHTAVTCEMWSKHKFGFCLTSL